MSTPRRRDPGRWAHLHSSAVVALALLLHACASAPAGNTGGASPDPLEPFNRSMYSLNSQLDRYVLKPVAKAYVAVTPKPARTGVSNFFANLQDAWSGVNNVLQGKGREGLETFARFGVNTVAGFFGLFDVASPLGLDRYSEDFGQTLGRWGVGAGPYVVLPLLGPSTLRDTAALTVDWSGDLLAREDDMARRNSLYGLRVVNTRAAYLQATDLVDQAALDPYSFVREAYLQRRRSLVLDGNTPQDPQATEPEEERYDLPAPTAPASPASPPAAP